MNTLVLKSTASLVNPPADTPIFSALPYLPQASFNAKKLVDTNEVGKPVNLPFSFDGIAPANTRSFATSGTTGSPTLAIDDEVYCLDFDGTTTLGQSKEFKIESNFTVAVVFKVDEYAELADSRIISCGAVEGNRSYFRVSSSGLVVGAGSGSPEGYIDTSKPNGFVSIVIKFNAENSRYVNSNGGLSNIVLNKTTSPSTFLRMGTRFNSAVTRGFKGKIAGWKFYQEDLTDVELIALHEEMRILHSV